jgi:dihydropyrimidinase
LGIYTLKLFTTYSDSGRRTYDDSIIELLKLSEKHHFLIEAHIENDDMIKLNPKYTYKDLLTSRPSESETTEALKLAGFVQKYGGKFYMVHLSSGRTLEALIKTYPEIINKSFFIESCPQYFTFTSEVLQQEDGYLYSFAPPLRSIAEQRLLFDYADRIDTIGTDHCSFNRADKMKRKLSKTPLGIGGIEYSLPVMRHHLGDAAIKKMTSRVATLMGLEKKGKLEVGYDADLAIFKPNSGRSITISHGLADYSVYTGQKAAGIVVSTMIRGHFVMKDRQYLGGPGKWIKGNEIV